MCYNFTQKDPKVNEMKKVELPFLAFLYSGTEISSFLFFSLRDVILVSVTYRKKKLFFHNQQ